MTDAPGDTAQAITAVTAHIANNPDSFDTDGKRTLFFVKELFSANVLSITSSREEASVVGAVVAAHAALGVRPRDIKLVISLERAAINGDKIAEEIVDGLREGRHQNGDSAYSHWKRAAKTARGDTSSKRKKKTCSFMPRNLKLTAKDRAWALSTAKALKKKFKTSGQRSIAMNKALVERGLASPSKSGGPASPLKIRKMIAKELGIGAYELGLGMTILRRKASGAITPGAIEALESGYYETCNYVVEQFTGRRRRAYIEKAKSREWLRSEAMAVASNRTLIMPAQRVLAYLEAMIEHEVLDPLVQISRQAKTVAAVAAKWIPASMREVEACWAMLRAIARKDLPASAVDGIRAGVTTANALTSARGGILGLAKTLKGGAAKTGVFVTETETPVEIVDLRVADAPPPEVDDSDEAIGDPIAALHDFTSDASGVLSRIIAKAEGLKDTELVTFARRFREHVGFYKMQANKLRNRRSVMQGRTK